MEHVHRDVAANIVANRPEVLLPDRPIAFNRDFVRLGIGVKGALFLSQALYWTRRTKDETGWFYKTVEDWTEETGLTGEEQLTAKKILVKKGYLIVQKRGVPARNFFLVLQNAVACDLTSIADDKWTGNTSTSGRESPRLVDGKAHDIQYTESTTKNTTYTQYGAMIIKAFETINTDAKRWYGNTTQRKAADELIADHGLRETLNVIELLPQTNAQRYFPTITSPVQLRDKWAQLAAAYYKQQSATPNSVKI